MLPIVCTAQQELESITQNAMGRVVSWDFMELSDDQTEKIACHKDNQDLDVDVKQIQGLSTLKRDKSDDSFVKISPLSPKRHVICNHDSAQKKHEKENEENRKLKLANESLQKQIKKLKKKVDTRQRCIMTYAESWHFLDAQETANMEKLQKLWGMDQDPQKEKIRKLVELAPIRALVVAARKNELELCKFLVGTKKVNVDGADRSGMTPLMAAAEEGHLRIAQYFIEQKKAKVNKQHKHSGMTAAMFSSIASHTVMTDYLVQHGADLTTLKGGIKLKKTTQEWINFKKDTANQLAAKYGTLDGNKEN